METPPRPDQRPSGSWFARHRRGLTAAGVILLGLIVLPGIFDDPADTAPEPGSTDAPLFTGTTPASEPSAVAVLEVPDLGRFAREKAVARLLELGLDPEVEFEYSMKQAGTVLATTPRPGVEVQEGGTVTLLVAKPPPVVPLVIGAKESQARATLKEAGYRVDVRTKATSEADPGTVVDQKPGLAGRLMPGGTVTIIVAKAEPPPCDPNYSGACVPIVSYDLDCADINGPVYVGGSDPHRFDGDGDGVGCET